MFADTENEVQIWLVKFDKILGRFIKILFSLVSLSFSIGENVYNKGIVKYE